MYNVGGCIRSKRTGNIGKIIEVDAYLDKFSLLRTTRLVVKFDAGTYTIVLTEANRDDYEPAQSK